jgi:hypothetical protein
MELLESQRVLHTILFYRFWRLQAFQELLSCACSFIISYTNPKSNNTIAGFFPSKLFDLSLSGRIGNRLERPVL